MSKHTPGPWTSWDTGFGISVATAIDQPTASTAEVVSTQICKLAIPYPNLPSGDWDKAWKKTKANARLIAAAPEMLAALKEALEYLDDPESKISQTVYRAILIAEGEGR